MTLSLCKSIAVIALSLVIPTASAQNASANYEQLPVIGCCRNNANEQENSLQLIVNRSVEQCAALCDDNDDCFGFDITSANRCGLQRRETVARASGSADCRCYRHVNLAPTALPTAAPSSLSPTAQPVTVAPTTNAPTTIAPTTLSPTSSSPTLQPVSLAPTSTAPSHAAPTSTPTARPTHLPTAPPTTSPTEHPTTLAPISVAPTRAPTFGPTQEPSTTAPSASPSSAPLSPTAEPSSAAPTEGTVGPTETPTARPTHSPSAVPTSFPTQGPTTLAPVPTFGPTQEPSSAAPTAFPISVPSSPTKEPSSSAPTASTAAPIDSDDGGGTDAIIWIIIAVFGGLCLLFAIFFLKSRRKREMHKTASPGPRASVGHIEQILPPLIPQKQQAPPSGEIIYGSVGDSGSEPAHENDKSVADVLPIYSTVNKSHTHAQPAAPNTGPTLVLTTTQGSHRPEGVWEEPTIYTTVQHQSVGTPQRIPSEVLYDEPDSPSGNMVYATIETVVVGETFL